MGSRKVNGLLPMSNPNKTLYTQVKGEVLFNTELSAGAYRFYCLILYLSGKNTHCWYKQHELAAFMGLKGKHADRTIRGYSKECEDKSLLRVVRPGFHQANKYYPLVKVIPQNKQVIHDETPTPQGRGQKPGLNRGQTTVKSHAPNNNQHDRANRPKNGFKIAQVEDPYAKTKAYLAGERVQWSN